MIPLLLFPPALATEGTLTVPLAELEARIAASALGAAAPAEVVLGEARWSGTADAETLALALDAELRVALVGDGYKEVPLLGSEAVLLSAEVDGRPVPVVSSGGMHVWSTDATGDRRVRVRALVPPSGPRGALEYDFGIPRTASTALALVLPRPGLRPEVTDAVVAEVRTVGGTTVLTADLAPTGRVKLLGLKDLGDAEAKPPKLYAEATHLLAVDDDRLELFTVVRYGILYAGARRFEVFVPEGFEVVSADGEGAFGWEIVATGGGNLLRGETAYPIRNRYELSLVLQRELPETATRLALPHPVGVERHHGWVGLEAPGRVRIESVTAEGALAVDPRQLPEELRRASVSPLLHAFRTTSERATLGLETVPLPEVEVSAERIDRVEARTIVSANGRAVTDLALVLRNRLRHGLLLDLPDGTEVTRALLDGEPVVPSRASTGQVVVPLRRSGPDEAFTVQLVLSGEAGVPGWLGWTGLALPTLDLPASEVRWDVHWPRDWRWSGLRSVVATQERVGWGQWLAASAAVAAPPSNTAQLAAPSDGPSASYARYWVPAGEVVAVWAWHTAPGLRTSALGAALLALLAAGAASFRRWSRSSEEAPRERG